MKKMNFEQMENLQGGSTGCDALNSPAVKTIALIASVVSCFGPIGLAIGGPTSLGLAAGAVICAAKG